MTIYSNAFELFLFVRELPTLALRLIMNAVSWRDEWQLLVETIKRQDFEHALEKSNRRDLLLTAKGVAITSIATGVGALLGGLAYGPLGALAGSTAASIATYGSSVKYKSVYELIKQLSGEESYQLLLNVKAVLGGLFNEQTIILGAVGNTNGKWLRAHEMRLSLVVAKELFRFVSEMRRSVTVTQSIAQLSSSNNFMIMRGYD